MIILIVIILYCLVQYILMEFFVKYILPNCITHYKTLDYNKTRFGTSDFDDGSIMYKIGKKYCYTYDNSNMYHMYLYCMFLFFPLSYFVELFVGKIKKHFSNKHKIQMDINNAALILYAEKNKQIHIGKEYISFKECVKIVKKNKIK